MKKNKINVFKKKKENEENIKIEKKDGIGRGEKIVEKKEEGNVLKEEKDVK